MKDGKTMMETGESQVCVLCQTCVDGAALSRVSELAVCDACRSGEIRQRIKSRGWILDTEVKAAGQDGNRSFEFHLITVRGQASETTSMNAFFRKTLTGDGVMGFFLREVQAGDKLFDDAVFVVTKKRELTKSFLQGSFVQAAILEIIAMAEGQNNSVTIRGGEVITKVFSRRFETVSLAELQTCILLLRLDDFAKQNVPRSPYRREFPKRRRL